MHDELMPWVKAVAALVLMAVAVPVGFAAGAWWFLAVMDFFFR